MATRSQPRTVEGPRRIRGPRLEQPIANNVEIVGHSDMGGKLDALQMNYQEVGGRHYLYAGHFWSDGVSILDVTDPAKPVVAGFVPTPNKHTWHIKVQIAENLMMIPCELNFFVPEADATQAKSGVRFFDASNPTDPKEISYYAAGGIGVHRSWWNGGQYAYLSAGTAAPGIFMHGVPDMTRVMTTLDVSDPKNPRKVSDFWLPEQQGKGTPPGEGETLYAHEPTIEGDRAYIAYWDGGFAIVDISDRTKPQLISHVRTFPDLSDGNTHTCLPLPERNILIVVEENTHNFAGEGPKSIWAWDISDEEKPEIISRFPIPEPSSEEPYGSYLERGERFGPHCVHQNHVNQLRSVDKIYATYCNAGLRIYDIKDASNPREVASFVPPDPSAIVDPRPYDREFDMFHGGSRTACTQDVLVDPRGYIYLSGTNDGIWIVKETDLA
jgi:hypothetical protein